MKIFYKVNLFCLIFLNNKIYSDPFPIQFAIPEVKIIKEVPTKNRDFAFIIPGDLKTYIYNNELEYYKGYQNSYFAITRAKGGWDCMRHYEILANGCIPYFIDIDKCNPNTMIGLPKDLIWEAMHLDGVPRINVEQSFNPKNLKIDHKRFNKKKYYEILNKLLDHTRKYLTTRAMAEYLLRKINYNGTGTVLYLSNEPTPDYMRCCMLIGLKELLGDRVIDYPKIEHIYKTYPDSHHLYGRGFSYTRVSEDFTIDRENIEQRIKNKEFDIVIYGSVHRGLRFHDTVCNVYDKHSIAYICGEDSHKCEFSHWNNLFLREFDAYISK